MLLSLPCRSSNFKCLILSAQPLSTNRTFSQQTFWLSIVEIVEKTQWTQHLQYQDPETEAVLFCFIQCITLELFSFLTMTCQNVFCEKVCLVEQDTTFLPFLELFYFLNFCWQQYPKIEVCALACAEIWYPLLTGFTCQSQFTNCRENSCIMSSVEELCQV